MSRAEDLLHRLQAEGVAAIDELIADRAREEFFLDFKRSSDGGSGRRLSDPDRNNLAKAISGFGNSEGGVLVWGVECSPGKDLADVATAKFPIKDVRRFASLLEGTVSGCTVPPHSGVTQLPLEEAGGQEGFVVTFIPKCTAMPLQVVGKGVYYIRAGSHFSPAPHGVVAGLFGRYPQAEVVPLILHGPAKLEGEVAVGEVGVVLRNNGPGIATNLYVNVMVTKQPGTNCQIAFKRNEPEIWSGAMSFGFHTSLISKPDYRLAPEAQAMPVLLNYRLAPPFTNGLEVSIMAGAGTSVPERFEVRRTAEQLSALYDEFKIGWSNPAAHDESGVDFARKLIAKGEEHGER